MAARYIPAVAEVRHEIHQGLSRKRSDDRGHVWVRGWPQEGDDQDPPLSVLISLSVLEASDDLHLSSCGQFFGIQGHRENLGFGVSNERGGET